MLNSCYTRGFAPKQEEHICFEKMVEVAKCGETFPLTFSNKTVSSKKSQFLFGHLTVLTTSS